MGSRRQQQLRVHQVLKEAISTLCMQELDTISGFSVEALIGITPYDGNVMLISINENIDVPDCHESLEDNVDDMKNKDPTWPRKRRLMTHTKRKRKRGRPQKLFVVNDKLKANPNVDVELSVNTVSTDGSTEKAEDCGTVISQGCDEAEDSGTVISQGCNEAVMDDPQMDNTDIPEDFSDDITHLLDVNTDQASETSQDLVKDESGDTDGDIPQVGPFRCTECSAVYKYRKCYIEHRMKCHQGGQEETQPEDWPCTQCNKVFASKRSLKLHSAVHSGDRQRYPCLICNQQFLSKRNVDFHVSTVHRGNYPFVCDLCGKQATTKLALESHKASKHDINKVKCDKCHREYAKAAALDSHICVEKRPKFEETLCHICNKEFDLPQRLIQHMAKHLEPRYQCESCGRNFKWASSLQAHKVAAHACVEGTKQQKKDPTDQQTTDTSIQMSSDSAQKKQQYQQTALVASMYQANRPDNTQLETYGLTQQQQQPGTTALLTTRPPDASHPTLHQVFNNAEHMASVNQSYFPGMSFPATLTDVSVDQVHAVWQTSFVNQDHHS